MIMREKYEFGKSVGLLPVTAAAVVGTWVGLWVILAGAALMAALLGLSVSSDTTFWVCVLPMILVILPGGMLNVVSDVTQLVQWAHGRKNFVGASSRSIRFWRLVFTRVRGESGQS